MLESNSKKYSLALHTSSAQLGLSISNFVGDTRSQTWDLDRELSTYLHQYLVEFLQPQTWQDLAFIAVAKGPGSFTSTRIGVVTARTIAQQLNIPIFAISSLAALAWSRQEEFFYPPLIAMQMEATRGQLYAGIYQISDKVSELTTRLPDILTTPEAWQEILDHLETDYYLLKTPTHLGRTALSVLELAYRDWQQGQYPHWSEILPFYGT